ncbi:nucleoside hydrolase-like domain-containing protein [Microbacteriaceae bacterium 4G12]
MTDLQEAAGAPAGRLRTIITADPELDDLNSMIRLLLYSNELAIEGLVYASSRFHWKGDGAGTTFFLPDREYDEPKASWRWAPGERFLDDAIDAYALVHENLVRHDPGYPRPEELRAVVREGNVAFEGDMSEETPGSRLIADALLDDGTEPVYLQNWAGTSTVARALLSIEERNSASADWAATKAAVSRKAVILKFASQDGTYDDYIRPTWPDIRVIDVSTMAWGYGARRVALPEGAAMLKADWMRENVTERGPLGALYRVWGDGRQMVPGDPTDYFHLSGFSREELTEQGFWVWIDPSPAGEWISEGDTTNLLNLFANGLRGHEHPSYGGWGGRAERTDEGPDTWSVAAARDARPAGEAPDETAPDAAPPVDAGGDGFAFGATASDEYSVTRWFAQAQRDFATRLRWSVTPEYAAANHHPVVSVHPGLDVTAAAGSRVVLRATAEDPDGDAVTLHWLQYREAGTLPTALELQGADTAEVAFTLPPDAASGGTVHVVVEACDDAELPLATYRRVIVTVT